MVDISPVVGLIRAMIKDMDLEKFFTEMIDNSDEATARVKDRRVTVKLNREKNEIVIEDNGPGLMKQQIENMARPGLHEDKAGQYGSRVGQCRRPVPPAWRPAGGHPLTPVASPPAHACRIAARSRLSHHRTRACRSVRLRLQHGGVVRRQRLQDRKQDGERQGSQYADVRLGGGVSEQQLGRQAQRSSSRSFRVRNPLH